MFTSVHIYYLVILNHWTKKKKNIHDTNNYTMAMTMFFSFKVPNTETVFSYVTLTGSLKSRPIDISGRRGSLTQKTIASSGQNCCM